MVVQRSRSAGQCPLQIVFCQIMLKAVTDHERGGACIDINAQEQIEIITADGVHLAESATISDPESVFRDRARELVRNKDREERLRKPGMEGAQNPAQFLNLVRGQTAGAISQQRRMARNCAELDIQTV